jgi:hypothetical protein
MASWSFALVVFLAAFFFGRFPDFFVPSYFLKPSPKSPCWGEGPE